MGLVSIGFGSTGIPYQEIAFAGSMSDTNGSSQVIVKDDGTIDTTSTRSGSNYVTTGEYLEIENSTTRLTITALKAGTYMVGSGTMSNDIQLTERTVSAGTQLVQTSGYGGCVFAGAL